MSFIETIPEQHAGADVLAMYERQSSFFGYLPNYARVFSHRATPGVTSGQALASIP